MSFLNDSKKKDRMSQNHQHLSKQTIDTENIKEFAKHLNDLTSFELVDLITAKPIEEGFLIFNSLSDPIAQQTFEYLPLKIQQEFLNLLPSQQVAKLLNALAPDDRTTLLETLPNTVVNQLLKYLSPEERALSIKLLGYPENSVGRLMTPDYISIKLDWTAKQVLDYIREKGKDSETINVIYAVDDNGVLIDDFKIRQFLLAPLDTKASELSDKKFISLSVNDDEEKAINVFRKYNRVALPVTDAKGLLLGIVTFDDIMAVSVQEDTEDMQKIGGVEALNAPYMKIPFFELMHKRVGWLVVLFLGEMLTASAMAFYEQEIAKAVVLALFIPLIISSGGNAGSQASTLIIRAMALGEVGLKDWWRIMRREVYAGLFLGFILGLIGFFRITFWSWFSNIYGDHWLLVAYTIMLALVGVVLWGTFIGSMLPLALKRCGFDPAVSSAPFVATIVDVVGLIIYFTIAMVVLGGTLL